ncbi:unconventional myosin-IXb isoform X2 [Astyanax mexicanus]|uniref:unconventional myosin-IXb isoform X2 n=1 Tax=Astyanax mexicanus TaxID=7994 RepID=UPI0020CAB7D9|nr:unconventional myosin-IXb isoform X2 [Astyanax mexicanus]
MSVTDGDGTASQDGQTYVLQIYPRLTLETAPCCTIKVHKEATAATVIQDAAVNLGLDTGKRYVLAEVKESGGEEWVLESTDLPVHRVLLWPRKAQEEHSQSEGYYFLLQECNHDGSILYMHLPSLYKEKDAQRLVARGFLPPRYEDFDDLCNLSVLNEDTILENLHNRFQKKKIYTYAGSILVAINPFKFLPIYNPKYVKMYENHQLGKLEPHIFAIADVAYYAMLRKRINQCIVISGESGSGKTQSTNFLIHCLTALSQKGYASGVERTILGAGPVLEAFGNAKTAHNNNSSRFGKFIQVNYLESGVVRGAVVEKYLLEKSRLVSREKNERNYHVFYYLLVGASEEERKEYKLLQPENYHYLKQHNFAIEDADDLRHDFERLQQAMEMVGFLPATKKQIFSVLSAILYLGNVTYSRKSTGRDEGLDVGPPEVLANLSDLLKVKEELLVEALTKRKTVTVNDKLILPYSHSEAITARDSMAKSLYSALFDWIVLRINHALLNKKDMEESVSCLSIGVLDIFGFEDFETNSFEQFCINYANEQLQYYFNQHIFTLEQEEYQAEGITWHNIDYTDNVGCIQLISKKPTGLLYLLDEESNFPHATDKTLLAKFKQQHERNPYFVATPVMEPAFVIRHFAGKVKYQIKDFREKNTDHMRPDIVALLRSSDRAYVRQLIGMDPVAMFRWGILRAAVRALAAFNEAGRRWAAKSAGVVRPASRVPLGELQRSNTQIERMYRRTSMLDFSFDHSEERPLEAFEDIFASYESKKDIHAQIMSSIKDLQLDGEDPRKLLQSWGRLRFPRHFLQKNKSTKNKQLIPKNLLDSRSLKFIVGLHDRTTKSLLHLHKKKRPPSISAQFQTSLSKLLETLAKAEPFFIRCLRSNAEKKEMCFDEALVLQQLRYTGMLETVRIRRSGYGAKYTFQEFIEQFRVLLPKNASSQEDIANLLQKFGLDPKTYQIGKTKVYLKEPERQKLKDILHKDVMQKIIFLQRCFQAKLLRSYYLQLREAAIFVQRTWRVCREKRYRAATVIQAAWRCFKHRAEYKHRRSSVTKIQALARGQSTRKRYQSLKEEKRKKEEEEAQRKREEEEEAARRAQEAEEAARRVREAEEAARRQREAEEAARRQKEAEEAARRQKEAEDAARRMKEAEEEAARLALEAEQEIAEQRKKEDSSQKQTNETLNENLVNFDVREGERGKDIRVEAGPYPKTPKIQDGYQNQEFMKLSEKDEEEDPVWKLQEDNKHHKTPIAVLQETTSAPTDLPEVKISTSVSPDEDKNHQPATPVTPSDQCKPKTPSLCKIPASKSQEKRELRRQRGLEHSQREIQRAASISREEPPQKSPVGPDGRLNERSNSKELDQYTFVAWKSEKTKKDTKDESEMAIKEVKDELETTRKEVKDEGEKPNKEAKELVQKTTPEKTTNEEGEKAKREIKNEGEKAKKEAKNEAEKASREPKQVTSGPVRPTTLPLDVPGSRPDRNGHGEASSLPSSAVHLESKSKAYRSNTHPEIAKTESQNQQDRRSKMQQIATSRSLDDVYEFGTSGPSSSSVVQAQSRAVDIPHGGKTVRIQDSSGPQDGPHAHPPTPERSAGFFRKILKKRPHKEAHTPEDGELTMAASLADKAEATSPTRVHHSEPPSGRPSRNPTIKISRATRVTEQWNASLDREITNANELRHLDEFLGNQVNDLRSRGKQLSATEHIFITATMQFRADIKSMYSVAKPHIGYKGLMRGYQNKVISLAGEKQKGEVQLVVNLFQSVLDGFIRGEIKREEAEPAKPPKGRKKRRKKDKSLESPLDHVFTHYQVNIMQSCDQCSSYIWGMEKAYMCSYCKFVCHKKCLSKIVTDCNTFCSKKNEEDCGCQHFGVRVCNLANDRIPVPVVLEMMLEHVEMNGLYTEGIYRKSGSANRMKELRQLLEADPHSVCLEDYPIHTVTGLVKQWLRELPEPLMTFAHYNDFIRAVELPEKKEQLQAIYRLLEELPSAHYNTMERLIFHLVRVSKEEKSNRMNPNSLAIVFAPCILRGPDSADPLLSMKDVAKTTLCVEMLINEQIRRYNERMEEIEQLEYAETLAKNQLKLKRNNTMREKPSPDLCAVPENEPIDSDTEAERNLVERIKSIKQEKEDLACRLPDMEQPGSDQENLDSEASASSESLLDERVLSSDTEGKTSHTTVPRILKPASLAKSISLSSTQLSPTAGETSSLFQPTLSASRDLLHRRLPIIPSTVRLPPGVLSHPAVQSLPPRKSQSMTLVQRRPQPGRRKDSIQSLFIAPGTELISTPDSGSSSPSTQELLKSPRRFSDPDITHIEDGI